MGLLFNCYRWCAVSSKFSVPKDANAIKMTATYKDEEGDKANNRRNEGSRFRVILSGLFFFAFQQVVI
jgi:hypothetical protein